MNVLVADDERVARAVLTKIVTEAGHPVTPAEDGDEAWQLLNEPCRFFDVVFLDLSMPGMNGLELLARIRAHPLLTSSAVVICSASREAATFRQAMELGVRHYLLKPAMAPRVARILAEVGRRPEEKAPAAPLATAG